MNKLRINKLSMYVVLAVVCLSPMAVAGGSADLERRIADLERMLNDMKGELSRQAQETAEAKQVAKEAMAAPAERKVDEDKHSLAIYASLRPRLTYVTVSPPNGDSGNATDITDGLSRVGIKGSSKVNSSLTAVYRGEWDVDIEDNGNFGNARQAYVGLKHSQLGQVAFGKQWDPHYNIITEVTDIYNHRGSPFGYDADDLNPFRTNNLVSYFNSYGGLKVNLGARFNGDVDDRPRTAGGYYASDSGGSGAVLDGNNSDGTFSRGGHLDAFSVGGGYSFNIGGRDAYFGISYLTQSFDGGGASYDAQVDADADANTPDVTIRYSGTSSVVSRDILGFGFSITPIDPLYLAVTYQIAEREIAGFAGENDISGNNMIETGAIEMFNAPASKFDENTLDVVVAYSMPRDYKLILGYFDSEQVYSGYSATLQKQLNDNMRVYLEWVSFQEEEGRDAPGSAGVDTDTFSIGFRYNFENTIY